MACRDMEKSINTFNQIREESQNSNIELLELDLASSKSIRIFVKTLQKKEIEISTLINNAGILCNRYEKTLDGFELTIGVNYIGQYLLTRLLLPMISKGSGRIINTSSIMYRFGRVDTDFFQCKKTKYHGFQAYADSKLALLLFTLELSEQLEHEGITANSADPGIVDTNMLTMHQWYDPLTDLFLRPFIKKEDQGANTSTYLATDSRLKDVTGKYFVNSRDREIPKWVIQHPHRKALWQETESVLQL